FSISLLSYAKSHTTLTLFFLHPSPAPPPLHSFPTRRSSDLEHFLRARLHIGRVLAIYRWIALLVERLKRRGDLLGSLVAGLVIRSEEHTSEFQSLAYLVCRLLLEKKKNKKQSNLIYSYTKLI